MYPTVFPLALPSAPSATLTIPNAPPDNAIANARPAFRHARRVKLTFFTTYAFSIYPDFLLGGVFYLSFPALSAGEFFPIHFDASQQFSSHYRPVLFSLRPSGGALRLPRH